MDRKEYVEFIAAQERNFLEHFGAPMDKRQFLWAARKAHTLEVEQYCKTQLCHLQGKRLKGFIDEFTADLEIMGLDSFDIPAQIQQWPQGKETAHVSERQKSGKRTSRTNRTGPKLSAVPPRSNP